MFVGERLTADMNIIVIRHFFCQKPRLKIFGPLCPRFHELNATQDRWIAAPVGDLRNAK